MGLEEIVAATTIMANTNKRKKEKTKKCDQCKKILMERIYQLDVDNTLLSELLTCHLLQITQAVLSRFS